MTKTVLLIGKFAGELNYLKEALGNIEGEIRCFSFLDADSALPFLLKNNYLKPDHIIIDEAFPGALMTHLNHIHDSNGGPTPVILFTKTQKPVGHQRTDLSFSKSPDKKDYTTFLGKIITSHA
jgi:hypothetical protein